MRNAFAELLLLRGFTSAARTACTTQVSGERHRRTPNPEAHSPELINDISGDIITKRQYVPRRCTSALVGVA
jgi:hypothetical protein